MLPASLDDSADSEVERPSRTTVRPLPDGQAQSPEALYESHFGLVWRNLRRFGVEEATLEDAAQDVFLTVFRRWKSYDPDRSSVETWLFGILIRVASRYRRTRRRRLARLIPWSSSEAPEPTADRESPAEVVAKRQAVALLDQLLSGLDESKRELVVLVDVEQLSVPEAAAALDINLHTAYWRLRSGRQAFQQALARFRAAERHRAAKGGLR